MWLLVENTDNTQKPVISVISESSLFPLFFAGCRGSQNCGHQKLVFNKRKFSAIGLRPVPAIGPLQLKSRRS